MDQKDIQSLILISSIILIIFAVVIVGLFIVFQKRKSNLIKKNLADSQKFTKELNRMKIEVKEQTLRNIGWELHDNIGQLLTLAKIQLQSIAGEEKKVQQVGETITKSIQELRSLSKLINPDSSKELNLFDSVKEEINRLNRLNFIEGSCQLEGEIYFISNDKELIIFRIIQEFITNTIKHAKASKITVIFSYSTDSLTITAEDNGVGFNLDSDSTDGQGLLNIKNRANLIGLEYTIDSSTDIGTIIKLTHTNSN